MSEPTYYQPRWIEEWEWPDEEPEDLGWYWVAHDGPRDLFMVPVEPDYEAMVEAGRKANIDLVPEECEMLWRAGIGGDEHKAGCTLRGNHAGDCCVNPARIGGDDNE